VKFVLFALLAALQVVMALAAVVKRKPSLPALLISLSSQQTLPL
jgi:hypothetical protein